MTDAPELLPCPFCGGAAEWVDIESGDCFGGSFIQCAACWACSPVEFGFKENLTSKWNTRATTPRVAMLAIENERLRDALAKAIAIARAAMSGDSNG